MIRLSHRRRPLRGLRVRATAIVVVLGATLAGAAPAPANPAPGLATTGPAGWNLEPDLPEPVVVPGTGETIMPFGDVADLEPIETGALPQAGPASGDTFGPADGAGAPARPEDFEDPEEGKLWCSPKLDKTISSHTEPVSGPPGGPPKTLHVATVSYLAELNCNYNLAWGYGVAGVIDRTPRFDGQVMDVGTEFQGHDLVKGHSRGELQIPAEWHDGGRRVEVAFELFLFNRIGIPWTACEPLTGLRYLTCEGIGTENLHVVVGTGPLSTGLPAPVAEYVALGDSYGAGVGAPPYTGPSACFRGTRGYHGLLPGMGTRDGLTIQQATIRSCSASSINDMYLTQPGAEGPQLFALSRRSTRLVTLSIGGNDLGFGANLRRCFVPGTQCTSPLVTPARVQSTQAALETLYGDILNSLRPDATLAVLGYPAIFPKPGEPTCAAVNIPYTETELAAFDEAWRVARDMIFRAVNSFGDPRIKFVDMYNAFDGHKLCSVFPYAEPFTLPEPTESFHPNIDGHRVYAERIKQTLGLTGIVPF